MTTFEILQTISQPIILAGVFATLFVYYRQLKAMMAQLEVARQSSTAQNLISLINYLQAESVRHARTFVLTELESKPVEKWSEKDREAASIVCSTYNTAAILLQMGIIPNEPFLENWGVSIQKCYGILGPFIELMQQPDEGGPLYWKNFKPLAEEAGKTSGDCRTVVFQV